VGNRGAAMNEFKRPQIVGVVNITSDSFSDGGKYLDADKAIEHAEQLLADGADILDLGAAASNPHAERVEAQTEIDRLGPVLTIGRAHNPHPIPAPPRMPPSSCT